MIYGRLRTATGTWRGFYFGRCGLSWFISTGRPVWWLPRIDAYGNDEDFYKIGGGIGWLVLAVGVCLSVERKHPAATKGSVLAGIEEAKRGQFADAPDLEADAKGGE